MIFVSPSVHSDLATISALNEYIIVQNKYAFSDIDANRLKRWKWNKPTNEVGDNALDPIITIGDVLKGDTLRKDTHIDTHIMVSAGHTDRRPKLGLPLNHRNRSFR